MGKKNMGKTWKMPKVVDICVLVDPCDLQDCTPLIDMLENNCHRPNGDPIKMFPSRKMTTMDVEADLKMQALERADTVLIVLSDKAARDMITEEGDQCEYFQFIKTACEKFKRNQCRVLPLFLSRIIEHDGLVGVARFSCWSYRCKNEEVRAYMEKVGSLQGLFVDPTDWESKWLNLNSFYEETHNELVALTCHNFAKELDWKYIIRAASGACFGVCCPWFACCGLCLPTKGCWAQIRKGLLIGMIISFVFVGMAFFVRGFEVACVTPSSCEGQDALQNTSFGIASACWVLAVIFAALIKCAGVARTRKSLQDADAYDPEEALSMTAQVGSADIL